MTHVPFLSGEFSVFYVFYFLSLLSQLRVLFPSSILLLCCPFQPSQSKKQVEDNADRLVSPMALTSRLIQGTHPLNYYSDQE